MTGWGVVCCSCFPSADTVSIMMFTALHRELGLPPSPITAELIDAAVEQQVEETDDLDWKSKLPAAGDLKNSDFSKDVAAMANSGGGVIVYGVTEAQKVATGRRDVGVLSQEHERSLHQIAVSAISPPIFGLNVIRVGEDGNRAVVVVVPPSVEGPHLIYRGEYFGAPIRNNADTVWMREREIAAQYRARFDAARNPSTYLHELYDETSADRDTSERAWFIAVAHPKNGVSRAVRWTQEQARDIFKDAERYTLAVASNTTAHPLESVDRGNPRPGLRRWIAPNTQITDSVRCAETWMSVHFDGSVTLAAVVGGRYRNPVPLGESPTYEAWQISEQVIEAAVSDFMALVRSVGARVGAVEYEVRIGLPWHGAEPLILYRHGAYGLDEFSGSVPIHRFVPVEATVEVRNGDDERFCQQVGELALDCINQGGVKFLHLIKRVDGG